MKIYEFYVNGIGVVVGSVYALANARKACGDENVIVLKEYWA